MTRSTRPRGFVLVAVFAGGMSLAAIGVDPPASSAEEPGAATRALVQRVRENLAKDEAALAHYTYTLTRRSYDVSAFGKVSNGPENEYEVGPSPVDPTVVYRRLVRVDGTPLTPEERAKNDEKHRRDLKAEQEERARETREQRARREREEREARAEWAKRLDDITHVFEFATDGHEVVDGNRLLVVTMSPRPNVETKSDYGKHFKKLRGRVWVHEADGQLVRVDMEAFESISIGFGVIGRVNAGSRGMYRRARNAEGVWLPVEARFDGTGKTLVFRSFDIDTYARYSSFRPRAGARTDNQP